LFRKLNHRLDLTALRWGQWGTGRIVNEEWVRNSTTVTENNGASWKYQFQWWHPFRDHSQYMMSGHLGQYVFVNPETQVVVVRLGTNRGGLSPEQWRDLFAFVGDAVRPNGIMASGYHVQTKEHSINRHDHMLGCREDQQW